MKRAVALLLCGLGCETQPERLRGMDARPVIAIPSATASAAAPATCSAPSVAPSDDRLDARSDESFDRCRSATLGPAERANRCGQGDGPPLDVARLDRAVLPLDDATRDHVRRIVSRGRGLGRRADVFGLIGDSMTISGAFMRPLESDKTTRLAEDLDIGAVLDHYRGVEVERVQGVWLDSFRAGRAAKVGARATWPLSGAPTPLSRMIDTLSPAIAIVLYGGNDAAFRIAPTGELADVFERDLDRLLDALLDAGIVPVLHTLARHGDAPGFDDCGRTGEMTNWRIMVQTNAISARVVDIACRRHLPLIDLRDALDAADNRGVSSDGIHPSSYHLGSGILDARGLRCGYNIRNYVTLKMLGQLLPLVRR